MSFLKKLFGSKPKLTPVVKTERETDFKCSCGFGCNTLDALGWHLSECPNNRK